jgi:hypothetical protein
MCVPQTQLIFTQRGWKNEGGHSLLLLDLSPLSGDYMSTIFWDVNPKNGLNSLITEGIKFHYSLLE